MLFKLALLLCLSSPASAATLNPYSTLVIHTSSATQYLSGRSCIAASTSTPGTCVIQLNGANGAATATSFVGAGSSLTSLPDASLIMTGAHYIQTASSVNAGSFFGDGSHLLNVSTANYSPDIAALSASTKALEGSKVSTGSIYLYGASVGIGISNPIVKLDVNGDIRGTNIIGNGSSLSGVMHEVSSITIRRYTDHFVSLVDGSTKVFTTTRIPYSSTTIRMFLEGSYQTADTDWTCGGNDCRTLYLGTAPALGTTRFDVEYDINSLFAGYTTIADGSVTEAKIETGAVTTNKVAGDAITTTAILNGAVTNSKISDGIITTSKLTPDAVTSSSIIDKAISENKLDDFSVTAAKLGNASVTTMKLAPDAIQAASLPDNSISTVKVVNGALTTPKLAVDSVIGTTILNGSVTSEKLGPGVGGIPDDGSVTTGKLTTDAVTGTAIIAGAITTPKLAAGIMISTQNVLSTSYRVLNSTYQNTGNTPRYVLVSLYTQANPVIAYSDSSASPTTRVAISGSNNTAQVYASIFFIVLPGNRYKITGGTSYAYWTEYQ